MSDDNVNENDLPPGEIAFFGACYPPLQSGQYQLELSQTLKNVPGESAPPNFKRAQKISLTSPRFTLAASSVQMVYPPADAVGNFLNTMPNVVLTRRTLPWERPIDPHHIGLKASATVDASQDHTPWLALLTLYQNEAENIKPKQRSVAELLDTGNTKIKGPDLGGLVSDAQKQTLCLTIDISPTLFQTIAPKVDELKYLNHVRQVNTDGKEVLGIDEEGWYSVSVSNRIAKTGEKNTVYLVSLEGHKADLPGGGADLSNIDALRFAVLATWSFTAEKSSGDFLGLLQALPERGGIELMQMPNRTKTAGSVPDTVNNVLDIGYTTLQLQLQDGEQTNAWYRGPMVAQPTSRETAISYSTADQAIRYDHTSGLFDMSYAAAWQIGRLLALSDATFAKQYYNWRIANYTSMDATAESHVVSDKLGKLAPDNLHQPARKVAEQAGVQLLAKHMILTAKSIPVSRSHQKARPSETLPGVISAEQMKQHLQRGLPPILAIKPKTADLTE
ncbi:hypothetical protein PSECIP111951_03011 [Pseudoalteromonas holothuriae]|uniref:Uncharacterized protein n=1 Tax=Pseudoalteromonas holothuriae TaxID=2963714 RepID=A0ABN8UNT9_9GAMM|nr:hypothetical protein [Pseudoalteromonas sp. CIP111951]CAH9063959.1 hypothetical protein PSECIP111951_03011 [Pseudoalteromonas sp. CIP111951]